MITILKNYIGKLSVTILSVLFITGILHAEEKLSVEYLTSHELRADQYSTSKAHKAINSIPSDFNLRFTKDGKYRASVIYGGWGFDVEGTYIIKNSKVTLYINDKTKEHLKRELKEDKPGRYNSFFLKNGVLINDNDSLKYQRYIKFEDGTKFWDTTSLVKDEGLRKKVGPVSVITMGMKKGLIKDNAKVRERPDTKAKDKTYCKDVITGPCTQFVPKGEELTILGRTEKKIRVQKWENYWYYVEFPVNDTIGWMFGEFVELK